ncbi:MAG: HIT family protein [Fibrobacteres bacterium]|jgi:histidine triad (HIT) family protein|nr:HIT family protein [Fibrobacterota bacterium]
MATLFTRIIKGEIPSVKILEDERYFAFLDIRPINPGHTLVIPKLEVDSLWEAPADLLAGMLPFAQKVAKAVQAATGCLRVGVLVAGFEVPHAHIHLVPIEGEGELTFSRARPAKPEDLQAIGQKIREHL